MIYIIGVSHDKHQLDSSSYPKDADELRSTLEKLIKEKLIPTIAEEVSQDALSHYGIKETVSQAVAEENNLEYIFADPGFQERNTLRIKSRQETGASIGIYFDASNVDKLTKEEQEKINIAHRAVDALRENEWLKRIEKKTDKPIIFICGFEHADTFSDLLKQHGHEAVIYRKFQ